MQASDSAGDARASLLSHLQARSTEIEAGVITRINTIEAAREVDDPDYVHGLRAAVPAAIEFGLSIIETGDHTPPIPTPLLTQARLAARNSVSLDTVIRRYIAGRDELNAFLVEGIEETGLQLAWLIGLLEALSAGVDRLLAEVSAEYALEAQRRPSSTHARLAERIKSLLAGERLDTSDLDYDFRAHHLALVTEGEGAADAVRSLAKILNGRHLVVHPAADTVWAWIGFRDSIDRSGLTRTLATNWPDSIPLSLSEPMLGIDGWRVAHRQAKEVFPLAVRDGHRIARYADEMQVAVMTTDDVALASLRALYLVPLERGRDGGAIDRETLSAYFAAGRNGRATAGALDVSRQTVSHRLKSVEAKVGQPLLECAANLELALNLANRGLI